MPNNTNKKHPPQRLTPKADQHLRKIVRVLKAQGLPATMTSYLSELVLRQPIPNGKVLTEQQATDSGQQAGSAQ